MRLSVVICTWNRCELLRQTLERMTQLRVPAGIEWEVLVVNNSSTDATEAISRSFEQRLPLRYLFEPKKGKSNALNLALGAVTGAYLLYTDDDVLVEPDWMEGYVEAFKRHPECAVFGGAIEPWFEGTPPGWVEQVLPIVESAWAIRRIPRERAPFAMEKSFLPFGANLAIRTAEQKRFPYDPKLGPNEDTQMRGEETAVVAQMLDAGEKGVWVPGARVKHYLPAARQTPEFLRGVYRGLGIISGRRMQARGENGAGTRCALHVQRLAGETRYTLGRALGLAGVWVAGLRTASMAQGRLEGLRVTVR